MPRVIGLSVDTVGSYGREVIRGVTDFCRERADWVVAMEPGLLGDEQVVASGTDAGSGWTVDGAIVQAFDAGTMARLSEMNIPIINVSNLTTDSYNITTVLPDDLAIGRLAADYFLKLGLPHYGFCGHSGAVYSRLRGKAFVSRLREAGFAAAECDNATTSLEAWLQALPKPVGIFCCNDFWAHRALTEIRKLALHVPDEIAVLGVDDDEFLNAISPIPVSSIAIPARQVGYDAARLLEGLLHGNAVARVTTLPPVEVIARATTDVTHVEDELVAAAIRFVRDHAAKGLSVEEVLAQSPASRRQLERRFRAAVGRSISAEIRLAHIEAVKRLLLTTTLSIEEIATLTGFPSASRLGTTFRRVTRQSPSAFRAQSRKPV